jgi:lysophospholipase L1-like esterase
MLFFAVLLCRSIAAPGNMTTPVEQEIYFQKDIEAFEAQDAATPPRKGIVLFTGSSIFRFWTYLERDMSPLPVLNRAFGGARTWEVLHYMDRIVLPYNPSIIMYYCGSNDINYGARPEDIAHRFRLFTERVHKILPKTRIFFVSIIRAPQKKDKWDVIDATNTLLQQYCEKASRVAFIDVNPAFFNKAQQPRIELYIDDGLHFKPEAYREMTRIIKPVIEKAWQEINR